MSGENVLYLAGGELPDGTVTRCLSRYDPVLDGWHDLAPMGQPRSELGKAISSLSFVFIRNAQYDTIMMEMGVEEILDFSLVFLPG